MPPHVFPSKNDLNAGTQGLGRTFTEQNWERVLTRAIPRNFVISGLSVSVVGLEAQIAAGSAIIDGRYVATDEVLTQDLTASSEWRVLLEATQSAGLVTTIQARRQSNSDPTIDPLANTVMLARVTTGVSSATAIHDARPWGAGHLIEFVYDGDGSSDRAINLGAPPRLVFLRSLDDDHIFAVAGPETVRDRNFAGNGVGDLFGFGFEKVQSFINGTQIYRASATWTMLLDVDETETKDVTVSGVDPADDNFVQVHYPPLTDDQDPDIFLTAWVQALNTVRVKVHNGTGSGISSLSDDVTVMVTVPPISSVAVGSTRYLVHPEVGQSAEWRPQITATGIVVGGTSGAQINAAGKRYAVMAAF